MGNNILEEPSDIADDWGSLIIRHTCTLTIVIILFLVYWIAPLAIPYAILRFFEKLGWISFNWDEEDEKESPETNETKKKTD